MGSARQYSGTLGKAGNYQITVTLQYQVGQSVLCVDADLYLPESWANDAERGKRAESLLKTGYRPKWQIALEMIRRAPSSGLNGPVLADSAYGSVTAFRRELDALGMEWCLGIDSALKVIDAGEDLGEIGLEGAIGRPPVRPRKLIERSVELENVAEWAFARQDSFRKVTWRKGRKGPMSGRFAVWRVRHAHRTSAGGDPLAACWLIAEWPIGAAAPAKYFFANLAETTSKKALVRMVENRWWVEHSNKQLKDELGLDHFEGRSWSGWHHHVTLTLLANAFLVS